MLVGGSAFLYHSMGTRNTAEAAEPTQDEKETEAFEQKTFFEKNVLDYK